MKTAMRPAMLVTVAALLTACGGGGGGDAPAPAPQAALQGAFDGTLQGSQSNDFTLLALDTGQYWALYGVRNSTGALIAAGFIEGNGSTSGSTFTSGDLRDFGARPALAGSLSATFTANTISGTIAEPAATVTFSANRSSDFNFDTAASVADVAGNWTATSQSQFTVAASGAVSGSSAGCSFTGTLAPHGQENVFDVSVSFGAAPCALPGQTATGIAVAQRDASTGQQAIVVALVSADRTQGTAILGARQQ